MGLPCNEQIIATQKGRVDGIAFITSKKNGDDTIYQLYAPSGDSYQVTPLEKFQVSSLILKSGYLPEK